jgi:hypothetical protein
MTIRPTPTCTHFQATELPCLKCGNVMKLALIEPANPKFELRTYECEPCGERESFLMAIIPPLENTALSGSG